MFKVGDKVVCCMYGEGEVRLVSTFGTYRVTVDFKSGEIEEYMPDGRYYNDNISPALFHADGYKPPVGGKPNRKPQFEHDEVILVRSYSVGDFVPRHFKEWEGRLALCYENGKSSKTADGVKCWPEYKKYEE